MFLCPITDAFFMDSSIFFVSQLILQPKQSAKQSFWMFYVFYSMYFVLLNNFTVTGTFQSNKNIFLWFFLFVLQILSYIKKLWDESRCYTQGETFFRSPLQKRPLYNQIKAGCCYFKIVSWIVRNGTRASTAKIGFKCQ